MHGHISAGRALGCSIELEQIDAVERQFESRRASGPDTGCKLLGLG
jgi:hypothetical protein